MTHTSRSRTRNSDYDNVDWQTVYEDDVVRIELDPQSAVQITRDIRRVTFRWTWTELRPVRSAPGVFYKRRIEITEFNCALRFLHTLTLKFFDQADKPIEFDRTIPSETWSPIEAGSIAAHVANAVCALPSIRHPYVFEGEVYNDDRLFVLYIAKCTVDDGKIETIVYHESAPADHLWCLVTYRNTERYPVFRVDHFASREEAGQYQQSVEASVPRISLGGKSPRPVPDYEDFVQWKANHAVAEYDYRRIYGKGDRNRREMIIRIRRKPDS